MSFLDVYKSSGYGALTLSIVVFRFFDPFFTLTVLAIAALSWTYKAAMTRDELERELVRKHRGPLVAASLGALIVALHIIDISIGLMSLF